jgi:hypothetical protein
VFSCLSFLEHCETSGVIFIPNGTGGRLESIGAPRGLVSVGVEVLAYVEILYTDILVRRLCSSGGRR